MASRAPTPSDFPKDITLTINPTPTSNSSTSQDRPPSNILLLLHGLGDTHTPFTTLAQNLSLPETVSLSIRAPSPLPFGLHGYHWSDDLSFNPAGTLDPDSGFSKSYNLLQQVIDSILVEKLGSSHREIFILGYGQGGMVALDYASRLAPGKELGGVISIGGPLPYSSPARDDAKSSVLLIGAEKESMVTEGAEKRVKNVFGKNGDVEVVRWKGRKGDGMMRNREETRDVMAFLARRMRSRAGTGNGNGIVELGL